MKKAISVLISAAMAISMLAGTAVTVSADEAAGQVYYLNFKPEADEAWQNLAKAYTEETGVPVSVVTAASGEYETTLMSEMGKSDAPTLFQVNGPVGLANWKDYCYDLAGSEIAGNLTSDAFELKDGDDIREAWDAKYGKPLLVEELGELEEANSAGVAVGFCLFALVEGLDLFACEL